MKRKTKSVGVTEFKSRCLGMIDEVASGKTDRLILLKHNRPVAALVPIRPDPPDLWGAMRGSAKIAADTDLAASTGETWEADG